MMIKVADFGKKGFLYTVMKDPMENRYYVERTDIDGKNRVVVQSDLDSDEIIGYLSWTNEDGTSFK